MISKPRRSVRKQGRQHAGSRGMNARIGQGIQRRGFGIDIHHVGPPVGRHLHQHRCRLHHPAGPDDQEQVSLGAGSAGTCPDRLRQGLPEPDHCRPSDTPTAGTLGTTSSCLRFDRTDPATAIMTAVMNDRSVEMEDPFIRRAGPFLKIIDVLGDKQCFVPAGECVVGIVGHRFGDQPSTPCVPAANTIRIARESLDGGEFLGIVSRPECMIGRGPEGRDTAFRAQPCTTEDHGAVRTPDPFDKPCINRLSQPLVPSSNHRRWRS